VVLVTSSTEFQECTFETSTNTIAAAWIFPSFLFVKMIFPVTGADILD